jgi:hypothetical protein
MGDGLKAASLKAVGKAAKETTLHILKMGWAFLTSPIGLTLLAIVAAVGALTLAVKAGSEAYNKYNLALEEANKVAEHQK